MDKMTRDNINSILYEIREYAYCLSGLVTECPKNAYNYYLMIAGKIAELRETLGAELRETLGVDDNGKD